MIVLRRRAQLFCFPQSGTNPAGKVFKSFNPRGGFLLESREWDRKRAAKYQSLDSRHQVFWKNWILENPVFEKTQFWNKYFLGKE